MTTPIEPVAPDHPGPIELVVLDLDGTVLDLYRPLAISDAVRAAIAAVQAKGIPVTIATGRLLDSIRHYAAPLDIRAPVIGGQGAIVGDLQQGVILEEIALSPTAAKRAAAWIDAQPYLTALYFTAQGWASDSMAAQDPGATVRVFVNREGSDPAFYDHVLGRQRTMAPVFAQVVAQAPSPPLKFIVTQDAPPDAGAEDRLSDELRLALGDEVTIVRTHPRLVEGTAKGVDKGAGVLRLCARLGIDPARVLAIGDSDNDIPMLRAAGFGIAMGNATPGVRAAAKWIAPSIEEDGVAVALRRWILRD